MLGRESLFQGGRCASGGRTNKNHALRARLRPPHCLPHQQQPQLSLSLSAGLTVLGPATVKVLEAVVSHWEKLRTSALKGSATQLRACVHSPDPHRHMKRAYYSEGS